MSSMDPTGVALYLLAGAALGAFHFVLLLRTVRLQVSQAAPIRIIPLYLMRLAVAVSAFWIFAQQGALPVLFALLGFLIARIAVQGRVGSE